MESADWIYLAQLQLRFRMANISKIVASIVRIHEFQSFNLDSSMKRIVRVRDFSRLLSCTFHSFLDNRFW